MDAPIVPVVPVAPAAVPATDVNKVPVPAAKPGEATPTPAEKAVLQKIKVGDVEYDSEVLKGMIEKAKGADKKFLEAAQIKKSAMLLHKLAKENPKEFLRKTGMDPKKFAYDEVAEDVKNKLRDPKEVQLEEAQKRIKEFEDREAKEKSRLDQEKQDRQAKAAEQKFHKDMIEALEAAPDLPKNGHTVARIARYIQAVLIKTGELITPKDVISVLQKDLRGELAGVVKGASAEQLISLIGEEGVAAIRAYDLARLKDPLQNGKGDGEGTINGKVVDRPRVRSNQFWKDIDKAAKAEREAKERR